MSLRKTAGSQDDLPGGAIHVRLDVEVGKSGEDADRSFRLETRLECVPRRAHWGGLLGPTAPTELFQ